MIAPPHELGATVALPALGLAGTVIGRAVGAAGRTRYVVRLGAGWSLTVDGADLAAPGNLVLLDRQRRATAAPAAPPAPAFPPQTGGRHARD